MRKIKFRGKRVIGCAHDWVYGDIVQQNGGKRTFIEDDGEDYSVLPETVGMFTGLETMYGENNSRGGKEAYESDIIGSMNGILFEVYWSKKAGQWRCRYWNTAHKGKDARSLASTLNNAYMRIKGNIHET
jgi:hypothetical protein